jgi:hypothetical protein
MKNNIIGTFTEETYKYGKIFYLQTRTTKPCTEEEKRIYGVDVKLDENSRVARIIEYNCHDSGTDGGSFYEIDISWEILNPRYFLYLDNAKKQLIAVAKEKKLL